MNKTVIFNPPKPLETPVLFVVFNRLDVTKQVFQAIRQAKPPRLYIAADGARDDRPGESEKVALVREYITANIDWDCKVSTLFRDENLGCKYAPYGALNWFFEKEEKGIILEDDCLPNFSFFSYCQWALQAYENTKDVWHINGNNFECPRTFFEDENISFSSLAQVWGWATWRDRWQEYSVNPFYLNMLAACKFDWALSSIGKANKLHHLEALRKGLDAWDYQWQITILNHNGLCISSRANLISNLGDGIDATHTKKDNRTHLKTSEISDPLIYVKPKVNNKLTMWYEKKMGLMNLRSACMRFVITYLRRAKDSGKQFFSKLLFANERPIVIASTGRAGSTMLFEAVSENLIQHKYGLDKKSIVGRILISLSRCFTDRLKTISKSNCVVHKTHDLFDKKYENDARYIFIYGDPIEAIQSVEQISRTNGKIWLDEHLFNLRSNGDPEKLFSEDILNYEKQINSWVMSHKCSNVICLDYKDLWSKAPMISEFVGFTVTLPEKKLRTKKTNQALVEKALSASLSRIYSSLKS